VGDLLVEGAAPVIIEKLTFQPAGVGGQPSGSGAGEGHDGITLGAGLQQLMTVGTERFLEATAKFLGFQAAAVLDCQEVHKSAPSAVQMIWPSSGRKIAPADIIPADIIRILIWTATIYLILKIPDFAR
jgi:hypothetical protein